MKKVFEGGCDKQCQILIDWIRRVASDDNSTLVVEFLSMCTSLNPATHQVEC